MNTGHFLMFLFGGIWALCVQATFAMIYGPRDVEALIVAAIGWLIGCGAVILLDAAVSRRQHR